MTSRSLLVAGVLAVASVGAAEIAQAVTIKASYSMSYSRIRPNPQPVSPTANFDVTVNEGGGVAEQIKRNAGSMNDRFNNNMTLGNGWRVAGPNQLVRTIDQPQSTLVVTITTSGSSCTVKPTWTLKPGFSEFKFKMIDGGSWGFYTQPQVTSSNCSIQ